MSLATEESRAAEYRRQMQARERWERNQRLRGLPGNRASKAAVDAGWGPITNLDRGWDPPPSETDGRQLA